MPFCAANETRESAKRTKASLFEHCQGLDDELCKVYGGISVESAYSSEGACPCSKPIESLNISVKRYSPTKSKKLKWPIFHHFRSLLAH